jgi:hypothetical protein
MPRVLGSAVNPVLREGNSDRRVAPSVKRYARAHPHSMGKWSGDSKTHVSHMSGGDFYANEQSAVIAGNGALTITHTDAGGKTTVLKESVAVTDGDVIGASKMSRRELVDFFTQSVADAKARGVLLSLHLKATMMKVSDPIMFGHAVTVYYKDVFDKHAATFATLGVDPDNGIGDVYKKIQSLPADQRAAIEADIKAVYTTRPPLAMVDSSKGITNLHVPSDVIIDASMPAAIRASGTDVGARRHAPRHEGDDPRSLVRRHLPGDDRRLQGARRVRCADDGDGVECRPDGTKRRRIRIARQDVRDKSQGHRACDGCVRQDADGARRRRRRHLAHVPHQRSPDQGLGEACRHPCASDRQRRNLLARFAARLRSQRHRESAPLSRGSRYVGSRHSDHVAGGRDPRDAGARAQGPRHDLSDRQRAARLLDRSVSDPRARHEREDAVDRAAARRRRTL